MTPENIDDLKEALEDILPEKFTIGEGKTGELIIYTRLLELESGRLVNIDDDEEVVEAYDDEDDDYDLEEIDGFDEED